jgi:hypothetical protein
MLNAAIYYDGAVYACLDGLQACIYFGQHAARYRTVTD